MEAIEAGNKFLNFLVLCYLIIFKKTSKHLVHYVLWDSLVNLKVFDEKISSIKKMFFYASMNGMRVAPSYVYKKILVSRRIHEKFKL
jgi:hypothetical protein